MRTEIILDMKERYYCFLAKNSICIMAMLLIMASCNERDFAEECVRSSIMEFDAQYPVLARATDSGFANGDCMGVYVVDYVGDEPTSLNGSALRAGNMSLTYNEGKDKWESGKTLYWKDKNTAVDVMGYYPYIEDIDNPTAHEFKIDTRQDRVSTDKYKGGYEVSDMLWAKTVKALPKNGSIDLKFKHIMAGVTIVLESGEGFGYYEWSTLQKNVVVNNAATTTTINLETGYVEPASEGDASIFTMPYANSFRAVVVPKTYEEGSDILTISIGDRSYKFRKDEKITLESGKMHKFTIKVDKNQDSGDYVFTLMDESISLWIDDDEFHEGIVRQYLVVNVEKPGTFSATLKKCGVDYREVRSLKVT